MRWTTDEASDGADRCYDPGWELWYPVVRGPVDGNLPRREFGPREWVWRNDLRIARHSRGSGQDVQQANQDGA